MYGQNFVPPRLDYSWQYLQNDRWISNNYSICGHPLWVGLSENRCSKLPRILSSDFTMKMAITWGSIPQIQTQKKSHNIAADGIFGADSSNKYSRKSWLYHHHHTKPKLTQTLPLLFHHNKNGRGQQAWPSDCHLAAADPRFPGCRADCPWSPAQLAQFFSGNLGMFFGKCWGIPEFMRIPDKNPPKNGCDW